MYVYIVGEYLSEVMGRTLRILEDEHADLKNGEFTNMQRVMASGDFKTAEQMFRALPPGIQQCKAGQIHYLRILIGLGDTAAYNLQAAIYTRKYPDNPDIHMLQMDATLYTKNYPAYITAVNNLDAFIDKDPYLDYYRGLSYKLMEKNDSSIIYFTRLHQNMPDMSEALLEMIIADLKLGKTAAAQQYIAEYRRNKDYDQKILPAMVILHPEYARYFQQ